MTTGNPCPICRDEYLVLDHTNVSLLEQFISEYTGEILDSMKTGICHRRQKQLVLAVQKARNVGLIESNLPFREYDYTEYLDELLEKQSEQQPEQQTTKDSV